MRLTLRGSRPDLYAVGQTGAQAGKAQYGRLMSAMGDGLKKAVADIVKGPRGWSPAVFFVYDLAILVGLLFVGPFHRVDWASFSNPISGVLPSAVPWAGALGGVCISLVGVAGYAKRETWQPQRYGYWHLSRAALGAIFGSVAVLIVTLVLQNVKAPGGKGGFSVAGEAILSVIAFTVGFREETFRALIIRVADLILSPSQNDSVVTYALIPPIVDFGSVKAGASVVVTETTRVFNGGRTTISLSSADISLQHVDGLDITLAPDPATLATGESAPITLTWKPKTAAKLNGTLQVKVPGTTIIAPVQGEAT